MSEGGNNKDTNQTSQHYNHNDNMSNQNNNLSIEDKIKQATFEVREYKANIGGIDYPKNKALAGVDGEGNRFPLAIVGKHYQVFNNKDFLNAAYDTLSKDDLLDVGTFDGGCIFYATFSLGFMIINGEEERQTLTLINSYNGKLKALGIGGSVRIVCDNQYSSIAALGKMKSSFSVKHTKLSACKFIGLDKYISELKEKFIEYKETMELLAATKQGSRDMRAILASLTSGKLSTQKINAIEEITNLATNGLGNKGETMHDLFNGITDYFSNTKATKISDRFYGTHAKHSNDLTAKLMLAVKTNTILDCVKEGNLKLAEHYDRKS